MRLAFILSMPGTASWNGRWSGEGKLYAIVRSYRNAPEHVKPGNYYYRWTDGWCACVEVREVDRNEAARVRRASAGFCGYDWMVRSIEQRGSILSDSDIAKTERAS